MKAGLVVAKDAKSKLGKRMVVGAALGIRVRNAGNKPRDDCRPCCCR